MKRLIHWLDGYPRPVWIPAAVAVVLGALFVLTLGTQAALAKVALGHAQAQAEVLQQQLRDSNRAGAEKTLKGLQADTDKARRNTEGPAWAIASVIPGIRDEVFAVRTASTSIDTIADTAMPPAVSVAADLNAKSFSPKGGRIDVAALQKVAPAIGKTSQVLTAERAKIDHIHPSDLLWPLGGPMRDLQTKIDDAERSAHGAAVATELAPQLLGSQGKRRFLLIFQNNAEIRSTGGLTGAFVILTANNGRFTIDKPGSNRDLLGGIDKPVLPLTFDETLVYPSDMGIDIRDTNFTPDFPRTAALDRAIVKKKLGLDVDGVLSMDPVGLSYLLRGTGPVTLADGSTLTPDNAVRSLINEVYFKIRDPLEQDAYFASATQKIFEKVASGAGDPTETLKALAQGVNERRLMFWSATPDEQSRLAGSAIASELPGDEKAPQFGVYLNDATLSKMQYYLDFTTSVKSTQCARNGTQTLVATTVLKSKAPKDAGSLPAYVTGDSGKVPSGSQELIVRFYGTAGGAFTSVTMDGRDQQIYGLQHQDRPVTYVLATVKPGQTVTLVARSVTDRGQRGDGLFLTTPGLSAIKSDAVIRSSC